jgi:tryptophan-rich sensory protein
MARAAAAARSRHRGLAARGRLTAARFGHREERAFRDDHTPGPEPDPDRSAHGTAASWPALVGFVGLSLLIGAADAAAVPPATESWLFSLAHPPGLLPERLIAPALVTRAWAVLSLSGGLGAWLAWRQPDHRTALLLWGWHLLAFATWMQCLLTWRQPGAALVAALALALLAGLTAAAFARLRRLAGVLMLPTLVATCYAACVTAGVWWLNLG